MAQVRQIEAVMTTVAVALVTTAETVIITSPPIEVQTPGQRIVVWAWAQLTIGTATTAVTPRIRRGSLITGTLVGTANAEAPIAAAGATRPVIMLVVDNDPGSDRAVYSLTLQQTAATGNGSALQATIVVLAL